MKKSAQEDVECRTHRSFKRRPFNSDSSDTQRPLS
jgi:hypothetical protein